MVASVPFGIALAAVAIIQEEAGRWQTSDSMLYFAIAAIVLIAIGLAAWPKTQFRLKK